MVSFLST